MYKQIQDCRICYGRNLSVVLDLGNQALTGVFPKSREEEVPSGPLTLVLCADCGLVQLRDNYELSMLYGQTYGYRSGLNASMVRHLRERVSQIEQKVPLEAGDLVVDIGSNDGTLLGSYANKQLRRLGVDPSGAKFQSYYEAGVDLIPDFFCADLVKQYAAGKKARVVTSIAMFYDLFRPLDFVAQVRDVLAEDGVWVFEQSYLPSMIASNSYDTVCHEHLEYYTLRQIVYIAERCGMKIVNVEKNSVNGGSFVVTAAKSTSAWQEATGSIEELLAEERIGGFGTAAPFEALTVKMVTHREQLREFLIGARKEGKKVLGYGASTKGNVLLQYCDLTPDLLPAIAEVNPDKFGSFTPGTWIPIISEEDARSMKPDYFMVLPWHFRDGIVARESAYLSAGGKLIFPLPEFQIVG